MLDWSLIEDQLQFLFNLFKIIPLYCTLSQVPSYKPSLASRWIESQVMRSSQCAGNLSWTKKGEKNCAIKNMRHKIFTHAFLSFLHFFSPSAGVAVFAISRDFYHFTCDLKQGVAVDGKDLRIFHQDCLSMMSERRGFCIRIFNSMFIVTDETTSTTKTTA